MSVAAVVGLMLAIGLPNRQTAGGITSAEVRPESGAEAASRWRAALGRASPKIRRAARSHRAFLRLLTTRAAPAVKARKAELVKQKWLLADRAVAAMLPTDGKLAPLTRTLRDADVAYIAAYVNYARGARRQRPLLTSRGDLKVTEAQALVYVAYLGAEELRGPPLDGLARDARRFHRALVRVLPIEGRAARAWAASADGLFAFPGSRPKDQKRWAHHAVKESELMMLEAEQTLSDGETVAYRAGARRLRRAFRLWLHAVRRYSGGLDHFSESELEGALNEQLAMHWELGQALEDIFDALERPFSYTGP